VKVREIMEAPEKEGERLLSRIEEATAQYADPWLEREAPVHPKRQNSADVQTFSEMVRGCREAVGTYGIPKVASVTLAEESQASLRRSLYFSASLPVGAEVFPEHLVSARPALGAHPAKFEIIVGRKLTRAVRAGDPVQFEALEKRPGIRDGSQQSQTTTA